MSLILSYSKWENFFKPVFSIHSKQEDVIPQVIYVVYKLKCAGCNNFDETNRYLSICNGEHLKKNKNIIDLKYNMDCLELLANKYFSILGFHQSQS